MGVFFLLDEKFLLGFKTLGETMTLCLLFSGKSPFEIHSKQFLSQALSEVPFRIITGRGLGGRGQGWMDAS